MKVLVLIPFVFSACGEKEETGAIVEEVTCEWIEGDNCWKESLVEAALCAADPTVEGTFNADLTVCTYNDGTVINFKNPASNFGMDYLWDFEIVKNGSSCMSFSETETVFSLTTSLGTFIETGSMSTVEFQCPDDSVYGMNGMSMLECNWDHLMGYSYTTSPVSFTLIGDGAEGVTLFTCVSI